ncbi:hypothetical protein Scel_43330 [Streptomyces cellostaticus]|nr:hypothetical protein Scel_43330 [Streptomyces cellostaticus]
MGAAFQHRLPGGSQQAAIRRPACSLPLTQRKGHPYGCARPITDGTTIAARSQAEGIPQLPLDGQPVSAAWDPGLAHTETAGIALVRSYGELHSDRGASGRCCRRINVP